MVGGVGEAFGHMLTEGFPKLCILPSWLLSSVLISAGAGHGKQGGGIVFCWCFPGLMLRVLTVPGAALGTVDPFKLEHKKLLQCVIKAQP